MRSSTFLLASTLLNIMPSSAKVTVTDAADDSMAKWYPDLVQSPDYLGGIIITNDTDVTTPDGAVSDVDYQGLGWGIAVAFGLGGGYTSIRNAKMDCVGGKDGDLGACLLDVMHATVVHAGAAYLGNRYGVAWIFAYLAAQNVPDPGAKSRVRRSCPKSSTWPVGAHFNANIGLKATCKAGCEKPSFEQLNSIADLLKSGHPFGQKMEDKNSGAFQFTAYKRGGPNDGKAFLRCHVVGQIEHPDVCPADVNGSGC